MYLIILKVKTYLLNYSYFKTVFYVRIICFNTINAAALHLIFLVFTKDVKEIRILNSMAHSSSGLGRSPLKAKTGVRLPYVLP